MPKREYGDEDKAQALAFLAATKGDYKQAAKKTGVPEKVIRYWSEGGTNDAGEIVFAPGRGRPFPPAEMMEHLRYPEAFLPAPELADWVAQTFISSDGPLYNEEHSHLSGAHIGFLWTNVPNVKQMRHVAGTAEIPNVQGGKWVKARMEYQLAQWFGGAPDFLITLDSVYAGIAPDATFCARIEHELYHCGIKIDPLTGPCYKRDGNPMYAIRGHDVEVFVGEVRRYGPGHAAGATMELVRAAMSPPEVADASIEYACGTCQRMIT